MLLMELGDHIAPICLNSRQLQQGKKKKYFIDHNGANNLTSWQHNHNQCTSNYATVV